MEGQFIPYRPVVSGLLPPSRPLRQPLDQMNFRNEQEIEAVATRALGVASSCESPSNIFPPLNSESTLRVSKHIHTPHKGLTRTHTCTSCSISACKLIPVQPHSYMPLPAYMLMPALISVVTCMCAHTCIRAHTCPHAHTFIHACTHLHTYSYLYSPAHVFALKFTPHTSSYLHSYLYMFSYLHT